MSAHKQTLCLLVVEKIVDEKLPLRNDKNRRILHVQPCKIINTANRVRLLTTGLSDIPLMTALSEQRFAVDGSKPAGGDWKKACADGVDEWCIQAYRGKTLKDPLSDEW